LTAAVKK